MAGARSTFLMVGGLGLVLVIGLELMRLRRLQPLMLEAPAVSPTRVV